MEAPGFDAYYRAQTGVVPPAEFDAFLQCLRTPLPLTFRVNGAGPFAAGLRAELEAGFRGAFGGDGASPLVVDGEAVPPPTPLPWYPDRLAWQLAVTKNAVRKCPPLAALHATLVSEHSGGRITRQEAVSMVPPLLLDVQPHHIVLDACASPGSKTAQLLEALATGGSDAPGCVVANDKDPRRANMLAHTTARVASPGLIITCHDAAGFPTPGGTAHKRAAPDGTPAPLGPRVPDARVFFDRVLADVPCTGDGTLRKAPDVWRKWAPAQALGLHPLQIRIAARCAALLAPGGRMVYSTCSLNPVEDEAVVAALLASKAGESLALVDVSDRLPGLRRCDGLHTWLVPAKKSGAIYETHAAAVEGEGVAAPPLSAFPPPADVAASMHLDRCMRVLPHHGNTGGFFIAVLEKKQKEEAVEAEEEEEEAEEGAAAEPAAPADAAAATDAAAAEDTPADAITAQPRRGSGAWGGADPLVQLPAGCDLATDLGTYYGVPTASGPLSRLLVRSVEGVTEPRRVYAVSEGAQRLLAADASRGRRLKVATAGVKAFERQSRTPSGWTPDDGPPPPPYRVSHEGLRLLAPLLTKRVVRPTVVEVLALLDERVVALPAGVHVGLSKKADEEEKAGGGDALAEDGDAPAAADAAPNPTQPPRPPRKTFTDTSTLADVSACSPGGSVVALRPADADALGFGAAGFVVAAWRGRASVTVHVNKNESAAYAARLRGALRGAGRAEEAGEASVATVAEQAKAEDAPAAVDAVVA